MKAISLRTAALAIAIGAAAASTAAAQSFGIAAGPAVERGATTGGLVQLSYFKPTAFSRLGFRLDGVYTAQPGMIREGTTPTGEHSSFQEPMSHSYGVLGALDYRIGHGVVQPYALFGAGFYSRNAYTAGFTLGTNAGVGADIRLHGLSLFVEGRMHTFRGPSNATWTTTDRVRLIPVTLGLRF